MSDILNLTLKRDVFDGIIDGTTDKIVIDYSVWWNKRLKDIDTGRFKEFKTVRISSGKDIKYDYDILNIEQIKKQFVITVDNSGSEDHLVVEEPETTETVVELAEENVDVPETETDEIENEQTEPETLEEPAEEINVNLPEETETYADDTVDTTETHKNYHNDVFDYLDNVYYKQPNVYCINSPYVNILNNRRIIGCDKKFPVIMDCELRLNFQKINVFKKNTDENLTKSIISTLKYLYSGSYVFVKKDSCRFTHSNSGEEVFEFYAVSVKKYKIQG